MKRVIALAWALPALILLVPKLFDFLAIAEGSPPFRAFLLGRYGEPNQPRSFRFRRPAPAILPAACHPSAGACENGDAEGEAANRGGPYRAGNVWPVEERPAELGAMLPLK